MDLIDNMKRLLCITFNLPIDTIFIPGSYQGNPEIKILTYMPIGQLLPQDLLDGVRRLLGAIERDSMNHLHEAGIIAGASAWNVGDQVRRIHAYVLKLS